MHSSLPMLFITYSLTLVYLVFLVIYLTNAKKTDIYMSQQDQRVRQVSVVITWISIAIVSLCLICVIACMLGFKLSKHKYF